MKEKELLPDEQWISIYIQKPKQNQMCESKIKGEKGFVGCCIYKDGYFETYNDHSNRFEITRWKHDLWLPLF